MNSKMTTKSQLSTTEPKKIKERKTIKADQDRSCALSGPLAFSHLESGHDFLFSPRDFSSLCEFVHCCHNTQIRRARIHINDVPCVPLWVQLLWDSLGFLNFLEVYFLRQIVEVFFHYLLK